jgi:hypothetical protein
MRRMDAPVGGDCGGMTAETVSSRGEENSFDETNSCAADKVGEPERAGATTTAGRVGRTAQQSPWAIELHLDMRAQHTCPALCVCCMQISAGAARVPINRMATAARWKTPCNMLSAYYDGWISR